ncbi:hypothetical protein CAI21_11615 [Alkalilimnicola ehrlichii]|uniref:Uncharacterized protein n=1 Tax=Alkalilimnicola ehrlichii TaxID=351052 RepID=A0A3E0WTG2_9GAMM|nr:hypothetical protein [Alkalilimnicola ehrlichii]RFA28516.1 hypothetical protein CAI21_11615 [Alkalilimnicola ehrlichii]RFA35679.1 hypothetical protein CAL65_12140 [Alkalilimnicola ehrlichii]
MNDLYLVSGVTVAGMPRAFKVYADSREAAFSAAIDAGLGMEAVVLSRRELERLGPYGNAVRSLLKGAVELSVTERSTADSAPAAELRAA